MTRIKSVLFDMDGVLYDSMPNHSIAWQQAMASFNVQMTAHDAYLYEGMRGTDTIKLLVKKQQHRELSDEEAQTMYGRKSQIFHKMHEAPIMPGIFQLMDKLKSHGITIGIVTGSGQRPLIQRVTNDFANYVLPQHIVTAYDVNHGKPDPEPYLMGLKKTGNVSPEEAIVVENAPLGVRAGVAAGIFTIAVNTGPLPDSALKDEGANIVFPSMQALANAFPNIKGLRIDE